MNARKFASILMIFITLTGCGSFPSSDDPTESSSSESSSAAAPQSNDPGPSAIGFLDLHKRHPDGDEGPVEFANAYGTQQGLERLDRIRDILESFNKLTEQVRTQRSNIDLQAIGNTSGEMQSLGFHNLPIIIEGSILKQEYLLKQREYELAFIKREKGDIGPSEFDTAAQAFQEATRKFQTFWDTKLLGD